STWSRAAGVTLLREQERIGGLQHEQRDVLERLAVVDAIAGPNHVLAGTGQVVGNTDTRAEILSIVVRKSSRERAVDRFQPKVGAGLYLLRTTVQIEVAVPAQPKIERK